MTRQIDVDGTLESWLRDGPTQMPDRLVDSIVHELDNTYQRRHLWLPGREHMNRMMIAVGGVAAVALLALVGLYFLGHGSGIGAAPAATPTPVPTVLAPAATPTPVQTVLAPAATPTPVPTVLPTSGAVLPGRYFVDNSGYRYTFTVSGDGWRSGVNPPDIILAKGAENGTDFAAMWLWGPTASQLVWGTACAWTGTGFTPGPSVDDLTSALAGLSGFQVTQPTPTTVSGYPGKELKLTVPANANFGSCPQGEYRSWDGRYYQMPGQTDDVRVLDLDGNRTLIFTTRFAGTPAATLAEQSSMFDSLQVSPVPATPSPTP